MNSPNPTNSISAYLPVDVNLPSDPKDAIRFIEERERRTATILNVKDIGTYQIGGLIPTTGGQENTELLNGQQFWLPAPAVAPAQPNPKKSQYIYRSGFDFVNMNAGVAIPVGLTSLPHGLSPGGGTFTFTRIYGTATNTGPTYRPLPYASPTLNLNIELSVDNTNINVTVGAGQTALTQCYIVLEYFKS